MRMPQSKTVANTKEAQLSKPEVILCLNSAPIQNIANDNSRKIKEPLTACPLQSLPRPCSACPHATLSPIDFSSCDEISVQGFTPVLDVICASASHPWRFLTGSQRSPMPMFLRLSA